LFGERGVHVFSKLLPVAVFVALGTGDALAVPTGPSAAARTGSLDAGRAIGHAAAARAPSGDEYASHGVTVDANGIEYVHLDRTWSFAPGPGEPTTCRHGICHPIPGQWSG
jgi:hypothetical protein